MAVLTNCSNCGKFDVCGFIACTGKYLCPECGGKLFPLSAKQIRKELNEKLLEVKVNEN